MSSSNCWFLTCIQVSQEAGQENLGGFWLIFSTCDFLHRPRRSRTQKVWVQILLWLLVSCETLGTLPPFGALLFLRRSWCHWPHRVAVSDTGHKNGVFRNSGNIVLNWAVMILISILCKCAKFLQSCPALCDPVDCGRPGSSVHGILQARILEWVAMPSSTPRDWTCICYLFWFGTYFSRIKKTLLRSNLGRERLRWLIMPPSG